MRKLIDSKWRATTFCDDNVIVANHTSTFPCAGNDYILKELISKGAENVAAEYENHCSGVIENKDIIDQVVYTLTESRYYPEAQTYKIPVIFTELCDGNDPKVTDAGYLRDKDGYVIFKNRDISDQYMEDLASIVMETSSKRCFPAQSIPEIRFKYIGYDTDESDSTKVYIIFEINPTYLYEKELNIPVIPNIEKFLKIFKFRFSENVFVSLDWENSECIKSECEGKLKESVESFENKFFKINTNVIDEPHIKSDFSSVIHNAQDALHLIIDMGIDYDGCRTVEGLKNLIDEILDCAREGLKK